MKLKQIRDDTRGSALIEFTVTIPFFLVLTFGLVQVGLLLYTQNGLQHGVEVAARCASVNYSANQLNLNTSCFTNPTTGLPLPSNVANTDIQSYAAQNSWGIVPSSSSFTVACPTGVSLGCGATPGTNNCGTSPYLVPGYLVTVTYSYNLINYIFKPLTLTATSCFPINVS
jgi:Flp pilus assembly protein TadG